MTCKHCGTEIAEKALICFKCGQATTAPRVKPPAEESLFAHRQKGRTPLIIGAVIIVALVFIVVVLDTGGIIHTVRIRRAVPTRAVTRVKQKHLVITTQLWDLAPHI